jgi:protein-tyrosine kinase
MSRIEKALEKANKLREKKDIENVPGPEVKGASFGYPDTEVSINLTNPYLVTITGAASPITEEYRKLKSMIVKLTTRETFLNTLMVTSALAGEGKSLTALNLAVTLAQDHDHTVLLVDADLRQPSLHRLLDIESPVGLSDCLTNGTDISRALIKTGIGKLVVLPSGKVIANPVELLLSKKLENLLKELKSRYADRYVIIDGPPILPFAEVHALSSMMDGVILVVREGYAPIHDIREALGMIKDAHILGAVYNDVEIDPLDGHYRYYYYRKYYHQGASNGEK